MQQHEKPANKALHSDKIPLRFILPVSAALGGTSELALDQMRAVDKSRIIKPLGALNLADQQAVYAILKELLI